MNEIKRQLDQLMDDTTKRAEKVMMSVEQNKRRKPPTKKTNLTPVYMVFIGLVAAAALFFTIGPFSKESDLATPPTETTEENDLADAEELLAVYNTTTKQTELFKPSGLTFIDTAVYTEEELKAMNIQYEMIADTTSGELGLFSYQCDVYGCGYSVVVRSGQEVQTQFSSYGHIPTYAYMPTGPYVALKLSTREFSIEESNIERNSIFLFNTEDEKIIVPEGANRDHFESPMWPIIDISIWDTGVLTYTVADIPNTEFDTIKSWQVGEKPAKEFQFDLTK